MNERVKERSSVLVFNVYVCIEPVDSLPVIHQPNDYNIRYVRTARFLLTLKLSNNSIVLLYLSLVMDGWMDSK